MRLQDAIDMARSTGKDLVLGTSKARWINGALYWVQHDDTPGSVVQANDTVLFKSWELAPPPPKRYTFEEALGMMRNGKWMRFVGSNIYHRRMPDDKWHHLDVNGTDVAFHWENLPVKSFDMMWEERP